MLLSKYSNVICVNTRGCKSLTLGKSYQVLQTLREDFSMLYLIKDDSRYVHYYSTDMFKKEDSK